MDEEKIAEQTNDNIDEQSDKERKKEKMTKKTLEEQEKK